MRHALEKNFGKKEHTTAKLRCSSLGTARVKPEQTYKVYDFEIEKLVQ